MRIINATVAGISSPVTLDIHEDGRYTAIGEDMTTAEPSETREHDDVIDAERRLVLPGLINAHAHIDKTLHGGPWVPSGSEESVAERIAHERRYRDVYGLPSKQYIAALVETMIAAGTAHIRSHTDVDPGVGIRGIEAVSDVAAHYRHAVDIEQVAFPQGGLLTNPGTLDLLRDAVAAGAQVVGGLDPAGFDRSPNAHLKAIFDLAASTGTKLDIHLHDDGTLGAWEMNLIADMTEDYDLGGKVAISHAFGIAHPPTQTALLERFAVAGVALINAAVYNTPVPPLAASAAAGVLVAGGTDGINDLWGPFGDGDMLRRAMLLAYRNGSRTDDELELAFDAVSVNAAQVLGIDGYGLGTGKSADFTIVDARSVAEAVATVPERWMVVKSGKIVARRGLVVSEPDSGDR